MTLLKRGQLAHPQHAELRAGRPVLVRPPTGQAAGVLQRLERELGAAAAGSGAQVASRPLVRLSVSDLWRPHLGLFPAREAGSVRLLGATVEARRALLLVVLTNNGAKDERLAGYASAGVRELWCVSLCHGWTVRYRSPWAGVYGSRTLWYPGEGVPVGGLGGVQVEALEEGFQPAGLFEGGPDCGSRA